MSPFTAIGKCRANRPSAMRPKRWLARFRNDRAKRCDLGLLRQKAGWALYRRRRYVDDAALLSMALSALNKHRLTGSMRVHFHRPNSARLLAAQKRGITLLQKSILSQSAVGFFLPGRWKNIWFIPEFFSWRPHRFFFILAQLTFYSRLFGFLGHNDFMTKRTI
jgi:hypothetical protein